MTADERNIQKVYYFQFFWLFVIVLPVLYPYYASLGVTMKQFFQLQAVFGFAVACFEIPTGYWSDRYGRKLCMCIGGFLSGISYLLLTQATGFWWLVAHEFLLGLALSFISGTDISILFESIPAQSSRDLSSRLLGRYQLSTAIGESLAALACSFLLFYLSYYHVVLIQAVIAWFPFLMALTLHEPPHRRVSVQWSQLKKVWSQMLYEDRFVQLLSLNFISWLLATFVIIWTIQKYWQEQHIPVTWFGVLWALCNILIGLSGLVARRLEKIWSSRHVLIIIALFSLLSYFLISFLGGFWGLSCAALIYIARGLNNVISRDLLNQFMDPSLRASANSLLNFIFRMTFAVVGPAIGYAIDHWGLSQTLLVIGWIFVPCFLFLTIPLWKRLESTSV